MPPITDDRLASRLAMGDAEFEELTLKLARRIGGRPYARADYEHAIAYPWERPGESFWIRGGSVRPVDAGSLAEWLASGERRYPVLTFGSNGSPGVLAGKLAGLGEDALDVAVLTGWLEGFEVAPSAHLAIYGALPATIVPSEGTRVRAGVILATATQFEAIARTEFNYVVRSVEATAFETDAGVELEGAIVSFVSRRGALAADGEVVALAAVEGERRAGALLGQAELLDLVAQMTLGENGAGESVVRRVIEDYRWAVEEAVPALRSFAVGPGLP